MVYANQIQTSKFRLNCCLFKSVSSLPHPASEVAPVDHVRLERSIFSQVNAAPHKDQTRQPLPQCSVFQNHVSPLPFCSTMITTSVSFFTYWLCLVIFYFMTSSPLYCFFSQAANTTNLFTITIPHRAPLIHHTVFFSYTLQDGSSFTDLGIKSLILQSFVGKNIPSTSDWAMFRPCWVKLRLPLFLLNSAHGWNRFEVKTRKFKYGFKVSG